MPLKEKKFPLFSPLKNIANSEFSKVVLARNLMTGKIHCLKMINSSVIQRLIDNEIALLKALQRNSFIIDFYYYYKNKVINNHTDPYRITIQ